MAATRITALPTAPSLDYNNDVFPVVDVSATTPITPTGTTSKATISQISTAIKANEPSIYSGTTVDPNGIVTAPTGSIYFNIANPATPVQWVRTSTAWEPYYDYNQLTNTIVVDNVAALKALTVASLSNGQVILTRGYYTTNDGGQGTYIYDSSSAATDNGGTVIAPTAGSGRFLLQYSGKLNVKQFGSKGNGSFDDTTYIQQAVTTAISIGIPVYCPAGIYVISTTVNLSGLPCFYGDGKQFTSFVGNNTSLPIFEIGGIFNVDYHDFAVGYGNLNTASATNSVCFNQTGNIRRGSIKRITFAESYYAWKSGAAGSTYLYSVSLCDIVTMKIRGYCFYIASAVGGSTGNIFDNIYCNFFENDGVTKIQFLSAFYLSSISESSFRQINVEHGISGNPIFIGSSAFNTTWESVHFEGVEASDDYNGFIYISGNGSHRFKGLTVYSCDFLLSRLGPGNFYSLFRQGNSTKIDLDGLYWDANTVDAGVTVCLSNKTGGTYPDANSWFSFGFSSGDMTGLTVVVAENNLSSESSWQKTYLIRNAEKYADRNLATLYGAGDSNQTYLPDKQRCIYRFGSPLSANRTLTLSSTNAFNGLVVKVVRTVASTGAFTLDVGGLKLLSTGQWCEVVFNGSSWELIQYGSL